MLNRRPTGARFTTTLQGLFLVLSPVSIGVAMAVDTVAAPPTYGTAIHGVPDLPPFLGEDAFEIDGVSGFPALVQNQGSYSVSVIVTNLSNQTATLAGWIDYDGNGVFDAREAASTTVAAGADEQTVSLNWNSLSGVLADYTGQTYSRIRITTATLTADMATGVVVDGEVEDYSLFIQEDSDGNGVPDNSDLSDSDLDGLINSIDLDSDNDTIPDATEGTVDTDRDGVPDYLDLDSDNDGIFDIRESGYGFAAAAALDTNADGRADPWVATGNNGLVDLAETEPDSGVLGYTPADTDNDGARDSVDLDSDDDSISDLVESGGVDIDNNGTVDALTNADNDAVVDSVDVSIVGGQDLDGDDIVDSADADFVLDDDTDFDGVVNSADPDFNGDGLVDAPVNNLGIDGTLPDGNGDGTPDFLDDQPSGVVPPSDDTPTSTNGPIETGLRGSAGCTFIGLNTNMSIDPALPLLALTALFWITLRRRFS